MKLQEIFRRLPFIAQLGLSLVTPILMCVLLCYWIDLKTGCGAWIYIPGLFFGIGSACVTAVKLYRRVISEQDSDDAPHAFNRHI